MPNGAKHWCFTINNPSRSERDGDNIIDFEYCILGKEVGDDGTPHIQGYIVMQRKFTFSQMKRMLPRAHLEMKSRYSSPKQAADYCKKDGRYIEWGELPLSAAEAGGNASRDRFARNIDLALTGRMLDLKEVDPQSYVQHYHSYKRIIQDNPVKPKNLDSVCGLWIWGETGVGKSYLARSICDDDEELIYDKPCNKWWDGYRGEPYVIIDDLDLGHNMLGHHLKRWADRYSFPAEQKGTTTQIRPSHIIVTSQYTIETIFNGDAALISALKRRFKVKHLVVFPQDLNNEEHDSASESI